MAVHHVAGRSGQQGRHDLAEQRDRDGNQPGLDRAQGGEQRPFELGGLEQAVGSGFQGPSHGVGVGVGPHDEDVLGVRVLAQAAQHLRGAHVPHVLRDQRDGEWSTVSFELFGAADDAD